MRVLASNGLDCQQNLMKHLKLIKEFRDPFIVKNKQGLGLAANFKLKSLILAQIERWRYA